MDDNRPPEEVIPDDAAEEEWCMARRADVAEYLRNECAEHGEIGEWPAWAVPPYVSVWAIESVKAPGWVGWWAIAGDLPTDYVTVREPREPRTGVRDIATRWLEQCKYMERGEKYPDGVIGRPEEWSTLAPLLRSRATMLLEWCNDDSMWVYDDADEE